MDKNMKILIVDDFSTMRRIIKNLLRDLGFTNTDEADDGNTALPMLNTARYYILMTARWLCSISISEKASTEVMHVLAALAN